MVQVPARFRLAALACALISGGVCAQTVPAPACPVLPAGQYTGQNLTDFNGAALPAGSLRYANFNGANLSGAVFNGQDLTGATFQGAILGPSQKGSASFTQANLTSTCFIGAVMNATSFNYASFNCTDFTGTSLMQANFGPAQTFTPNPACRTKFVQATIDVNAIDTANWGLIDFSYANFQNLSPSTFSLAGKDITGAMLVGTNFQNINMSQANLTQVDFSKATLTGANLQSAALNAATLVGANIDFAQMACARFYYQKGSTQDLNASVCLNTPSTTQPALGANLQGTNLTNSVMTNVTLDYAQLNWANLSGVNFRGATFRQASLQATGTLSSATIAGTNFNGANFSGAQLNSVVFSNSNLESANFSDTTLSGTSFAGAIMPNANFTGNAVLESVNFGGAVLQGANFDHAQIKSVPDGGGSGVSFSCAQLGGSNFTNATVTQATFANAVMPGPSNCCPSVSGFQNCGTISATGQPYGPVTYPSLTTPVTCPSGVNAKCEGSQWQLSPNWTTTYCSQSGLSQTLWQQPSCGNSPSDIVQFSDPNLQACILAALPGQPSSITVAMAQQQLEVICPGKNISSLGGLENFTGLQVLDLTGNQISQFGLSFQSMRQLKLGANQLTQLDLSNMSNVVWLDVSDNQLASLTGLANVYFQTLDVSNNKLTTMDISTQSRLQSANLSNNQITSVTDTFNKTLSQLTSLTYLNLSNNLIGTIGSLGSIAYSRSANSKGKLTTLFLACNPSFACNTLSLDGTYPAYQTSQCADFNVSSNTWVPNATPNCPNAN